MILRSAPAILLVLVAARAGADESTPNPPSAAQRPSVTIAGDHLQLSEPVQFEVNKSTIKPVSFRLLDEVVAVLKGNAQLELVEVQMHTDGRGAAEYNLRLSGERAAAVRAYLVDHGVEPARLQARGYGETRPLCHDPTVACWARNRRLELVIVRRAPR